MSQKEHPLTGNIEKVRDALLKSSASMRRLLIAEALPVKYRQHISETVESCEAGIAELRTISVALGSTELDLREVEDLVAEQATITMQAVKPQMALPQKQ